MLKGFWENMKRPIMVLAPMANVTDAAFRRIIAKYGKPDVVWTEFVSADGLVLAPKVGRAKLMKDLEYSESERPIVAQFFTSRPEMMEKAARLAADLGFDGVDINMGCPDRSIEKQKAGAALMKDSALAKEVILAARRGAESGKNKIPVSVKTRIGYNKNELETWLPALLEARPVALTLHARTRKEMSLVPARWEHVARAVEIRNRLKSETLILGNGDVTDLADARKKVKETGADGVMLGRAIFGNPWLYSEKIPTKDERLKVLVEHTKLFEKLLGKTKSFAIMKKHFKAYVSGWDGAKELRMELMETEDAKGVESIIKRELKAGN
jgi:nifR3 family TIM-barrel protein